MATPHLVDPLKLGMAQQARGARKAIPGAANRLERAGIRTCRRNHDAHWSKDRTDYSRKPGLTETRLRPLARRRDRTFCPPWVFMRVRNPCFLDRLRRLGWNVRFGMERQVLLAGSEVNVQTMSINESERSGQRHRHEGLPPAGFLMTYPLADRVILRVAVLQAERTISRYDNVLPREIPWPAGKNAGASG